MVSMSPDPDCLPIFHVSYVIPVHKLPLTLPAGERMGTVLPGGVVLRDVGLMRARTARSAEKKAREEGLIPTSAERVVVSLCTEDEAQPEWIPADASRRRPVKRAV